MARYRGVDTEKLAGAAVPGVFTKGGVGNDTYFNIKDYDVPHVLRVCPPLENFPQPGFWYPVAQHFRRVGGRGGAWPFMGDDGKEVNRVVFCLTEHGIGECPLCKIREWCYENDEKKIGDGLKFQRKLILNVVDRDDEDKMKLWFAPPSVVATIKAMMQGRLKDLLDPVKGRDIEIIRTGNPQQVWTIDYTVTPLDKSKIGEGFEERLIDPEPLIEFFAPHKILASAYKVLGNQVPFEEIFSKTEMARMRSVEDAEKKTVTQRRAAKKTTTKAPTAKKTSKKKKKARVRK